MESRDTIHTEMKTRLNKTRETITQLKIKAEQRQHEPDAPSMHSLEDLHARQTAAENKLEKLSKADPDNWGRHKNDLDRYLDDIDDGLRQALAYYH